MNKVRRKQIQQAIEQIEQAMSIIESVQDEEQDAFDNLPDGLKESERGETMEENCDRLLEILDNLSAQVEELDDIIQ